MSLSWYRIQWKTFIEKSGSYPKPKTCGVVHYYKSFRGTVSPWRRTRGWKRPCKVQEEFRIQIYPYSAPLQHHKEAHRTQEFTTQRYSYDARAKDSEVSLHRPYQPRTQRCPNSAERIDAQVSLQCRNWASPQIFLDNRSWAPKSIFTALQLKIQRYSCNAVVQDSSVSQLCGNGRPSVSPYCHAVEDAEVFLLCSTWGFILCGKLEDQQGYPCCAAVQDVEVSQLRSSWRSRSIPTAKEFSAAYCVRQ